MPSDEGVTQTSPGATPLSDHGMTATAWRFRRQAISALLMLLGALSLCIATASAQAESLSPYTSVSGEHLALSLDSLGSNNPAGAAIRVEKTNAAETVRAAYLFAASTGYSDYVPQNGDLTLNGESVEWEAGRTIPTTPGVLAYNAVANVTSIVAPLVKAAPTGLVDIQLAEGTHTYEYDGEILAVVLEDPAVNEARSFTLLYGAQNAEGDTFHIGLAEPINLSNPNFALNLSLGVSWGYQLDEPTYEEQYSIVKVNEKLLTSSLGGQAGCEEKFSPTPDYAACGNGELITVGGIGDKVEDPANPEATPGTCENSIGEKAPRCDGIFTLLPFVNNGESNISFFTDNPSNNDNIFFGALEVRGGAAVIGEGITISPTSGTNSIGESHTVTASVQNEHGEPIEGATVHFAITSGPNEGETGEAVTSSSGKAQFTYSSSKEGTDHIVAYFTDTQNAKAESNEVSETWTAETTTETTTTPTTTTTTPTTTTPTTSSTAASGVLPFKAAAPAVCTSKRDITIHIQNVKQLGLVSAVVEIDGKNKKTLKGSHLVTAINLVGLPKGTFTVEIVARRRDGKIVKGDRVYHTCVSKLPGHAYLPLVAAG